MAFTPVMVKLLRVVALGGLVSLPVVSHADDFTVSTDSTSQNGAHVVDGSDTLTINSGASIDTSGAANTHAVSATGGFNTATNNGTLTAAGTGAAVAFAGSNSTLNNTGLAQTTGDNGPAVVFNSFSGSLNNSGQILTFGTNAHGVEVNGSLADIRNTGRIIVTGTGADAVVFNAGTQSMTNSGLISSASGAAIRFNNGEADLTLNAPGFIEGSINLASSIAVTINTGRSHSFQWTFDTAQLWTLTVNGDIPYVISLNTVASIDPTQFTASKTGMTETAGQVFSLITGRTASHFSNANGTTQSTRLNPVPDDPIVEEPTPRNIWVSPYLRGSLHNAAGNNLAYLHRQAGVVAGIDFAPGSDLLFGLAAGGATGDYTADALFTRSHRIWTSAGILGLYGAWGLGKSVLDFGILGGVQNHLSHRTINNNNLPGGTDTGVANYSSVFLSPEVRLSRLFRFGDRVSLSTSASLGYTAGVIDAYTETASASTASFAARRFGIGTGKIDFKLSWVLGATILSGKLGYVVQSGFAGETITGTLLGLPWSYSTGAGVSSAGQVGLALDRQFGPHISGNLQAKAAFGGSGLARTEASANLRIEF